MGVVEIMLWILLSLAGADMLVAMVSAVLALVGKFNASENLFFGFEIFAVLILFYGFSIIVFAFARG